MKTAALLFFFAAAAVLLATAVADARATALDKKPAAGGTTGTALAQSSLGRRMAAEGLPVYNYDDNDNDDDHRYILVDIDTLRTFGLIGEDLRHVDKATEGAPCMTKAQCAKKKLVCSKKCGRDDVEKLHPFSAAAKCTLRCRKCVPTC